MSDKLECAISTLIEIEKTSSRTAKLKILEKNKKNSVLESIVRLANNSDRWFITSADYKPSKSNKTNDIAWKQFLSFLSQCEKGLSGNKAKKNLSQILEKADERLADFMIRILDKNLRIGMNAEFNKVFPNCVNVFGVAKGAALVNQKTGKVDGKIKARVKFPCGVQPKYDGWNISFKISTSKKTIVALSSDGEILPALQDHANKLLQKWLLFSSNYKNNPDHDNIIIDAECVALYNSGNKEDAKWKSTWGKTSALCKAGFSKRVFNAERITSEIKKAIKNDLTFNVYNIYPTSAHTEYHETPYSKRYLILDKFLGFAKLSQFCISPMYPCKSWDEIKALHKKLCRKGYEGSIIYNVEDGVIANSKTKTNFVKWKEITTYDAVILGVNPGTGKNKAVGGAFRIYIPATNQVAKCSILGDAAKKWAKVKESKIVGFFVEVVGQKENGNDDVAVIRNPVLARYRDDQKPMEIATLRKLLKKIKQEKSLAESTETMSLAKFSKETAKL